MTEGNLRNVRGPAALAPAAHWWKRISPKLVPVFAVITALIISMLFMMVTKLATTGSVDIGAQLNTTGTAYSALIEGSVGFVINNVLTTDSLNLAKTYVATQELTPREVNVAARMAGDLAVTGIDAAIRYGEVLERHASLTDEDLESLAGAIPDIESVGDELLLQMKPLLVELDALESDEANALIDETATLTSLTSEARAKIEAVTSSAKDLDDAELLSSMKAIAANSLNAIQNWSEQLDVLSAQELSSTSPDAQDIVAMQAVGFEAVREQAALAQNLQASGILDPQALSDQLRITRDLYDDELLTGEDVSTGLNR
jgi:hypothetical protein